MTAGNVKDVVKKSTQNPNRNWLSVLPKTESSPTEIPLPRKKSKSMYKSSTPEEATVSLQIMTPHGWTVVTFERPAFSSNVRREPTAVDDCLLTAMDPRANPDATSNAPPSYLPYCDPSPSSMRPSSVLAMDENSSLSNHVLLRLPSYSFYLNAISNNHYNNVEVTTTTFQ